MSKRSPIAISQRVDRMPARTECRDAIDQRLTRWLTMLGGLPLPVPNTLGDGLVDWLEAVEPAAVLLSGGNDIGDSPERDHTETALLNHAARAELPVLGICRGMQMLAQHAGGTLVSVSGHTGTRHPLCCTTESSGEVSMEVNSFHNWGLISSPPGYDVLATAPDGSIEAMRHRMLNWEGWMWHPEREEIFAELELVRARSLLIEKRKI